MDTSNYMPEPTAAFANNDTIQQLGSAFDWILVYYGANNFSDEEMWSNTTVAAVVQHLHFILLQVFK
jgi:hypothetical protein